ncbi:hypothetical protein ABZ593_34415 [Streptomyces sp. NPDC012617]|uniref:hypothetical protein n=2 Tax=Streptomyces TaxID=1883 RepID=UPI0034011C06
MQNHVPSRPATIHPVDDELSRAFAQVFGVAPREVSATRPFKAENSSPPLHAMSGFFTDTPTVPCSRSALYPSMSVKSPVLRIFTGASEGDAGGGNVVTTSSAGVSLGSAVTALSGAGTPPDPVDDGTGAPRDELVPDCAISVTTKPSTGIKMPTTHHAHFGGT